MNQFRCSYCSEAAALLRYLRSSYYILMVLNNLVATLVVMPFGENLPLYGFTLITNISKYYTKLFLRAYWTQMPIPCIYHTPLMEEVMGVCKFQRHHSLHNDLFPPNVNK